MSALTQLIEIEHERKAQRGTFLVDVAILVLVLALTFFILGKFL